MQSLKQAFANVGITPKTPQEQWDERYLSDELKQRVDYVNPITGYKEKIWVEKKLVLEVRDVMLQKGMSPKDAFVAALRFLSFQERSRLKERGRKDGSIIKFRPSATVQVLKF